MEKIKLTKLTKEELIDKIQMLEHCIFDLKGQVRDLKKQLKKERDGNLELIPDNRLSDVLKYVEESNESELICLNCESIISTKLHPIGYYAENNEVVYASRCPNCGEILYSKD